MKKNLIFSAALLLVAALVACTKQELAAPEETSQEETMTDEGSFAYKFKLVAEEEGTKALFATDHVAWEADDLVGSYASALSSSKTSVNKSTPVEVDGGVTITIRSSVELQSGDMVYAYAPFNSVNDKKEASSVQMEIPRNQVSGDATSMPLVALPFTLTENVPSYTNTEVGTLHFLNLGSIIRFNIYSTNSAFQGETIENVTFAASAPVAGSFNYNLTNVNENSPAAISGYEETDVVVTGRGTVGSSKTDGAEFLMIVAPGTYSGSFIIRTNRADYTFNLSEAKTFTRAKLKPFNIDLAGTSWAKHEGYDTSIDSPRELSQFLAGTSESDTQTYTITADLDMTGYTLPAASGFGGTLDGGDHRIYNISSTSPLFETNKGTIKDLTLEGSFTNSSYTFFGALVNEDDGGTFINVTNKSSVTRTTSADITQTVGLGGFVGTTKGGSFTDCRNEGAVSLEATGYTHRVAFLGGFVGVSYERLVLESCTNAGPVSLSAVGGLPRYGFTEWGITTDNAGVAVGGFVGRAITTATIDSENTAKTTAAYIDKCVNTASGTVTLNYSDISRITSSDSKNSNFSVAGVLGYGNAYIYKCENSGDVRAYGICASTATDAAKKKEFMLHVGGISGKAYDYISVGSCKMLGDVTVVNDCTGDNSNVKAAVGGLAGCGGYNGYNSNGHTDVNYSKMSGNVTVSGKGKNMGIGGIIGWNGKQWNNQVLSSCTIDVSLSGGYAFVGGLVGGVAGGAANYTIKACSFAGAVRTTASGLRTGGLLGNWGGATASGSSASLTYRGSPSEPCKFTGSVYSNQTSNIGIVVGYVDGGGKTVVFGNSDLPIEVSGTFQKGGISSPVAINATTAETYKWGGNVASTTIYLSAPAAPTPPPTPSGETFKAMTFNIREGSNWSSRKSPIVSMIQGESPDIIGLQEVKDLDYWDHLTEDHPWDYLRNHLSDYAGVRSGTKTNACLYKKSRFEVSNTGSFNLDSDGERNALYMTVHDKTNDRYFFYINTHFPLHQSGQEASESELESRIASLNTNDYPVVVMGDYNTVYGNLIFDNFKMTMNNTRYSADEVYSIANRDMYTYNAFGDTSKDRNKVDHIWVSKTGLFTMYYITLTQEIRRYGSVDYLSDHYPIIATLSF